MTMTTLERARPAAVAGLFYPAGPDALAQTVETCLAAPDAWPIHAKAVIAPHAGYIYSGPVAGTIYASLRHRASQISRVVLLGPAHRYPVRGIAAASATAFETPLGTIPVDEQGMATALALPGVSVVDRAFDGEHALEVQLPFLQRLLEDFRIVPLLVGDATTDLVDRVLTALWGGPETLVVVSSDLSHFHDYDTARKLDSATTRRIEVLDGPGLTGQMACGYRPIAGLLARARALDLRATTLDLRNSGDTAGTRDRVVGYGGYSFEYAETAALPETLRETLHHLAHRALTHTVEQGAAPAIDTTALPLPLQTIRRTFVTLQCDGNLRGCIGSIEPTEPLAADVIANAHKAAISDPRFPGVSADELPRVEISISVLSTPRPIACGSEAELLDALRPHVDGLILQDGERRALFLPKVWEALPDRTAFVRQLKAKAGLKPRHWSKGMRAWRFTTEEF